MNRKYALVGNRGTWVHLVLLLLVTNVILGLSSCGREKESGAAIQPDSVEHFSKPTVAGVDLAPKAFSASNSRPGSDPKGVMSGPVIPGWNSGDAAPQWIQLDLGEPTAISQVLLNVDQDPSGPTTHEVYGGPSVDNLRLLGTLNGVTKANQWLELKVAASDVRYVRVLTSKSPSWVAWREIAVFK